MNIRELMNLLQVELDKGHGNTTVVLAKEYPIIIPGSFPGQTHLEWAVAQAGIGPLGCFQLLAAGTGENK